MRNGFGHHARRPEHPDFWALADVVLQHDGKTEDPGFEMGAYIASVADPGSVLYVARQRAMRSGLRDPLRVAAMSGVWVDGFMVGAALAGRRGLEQAT